jgi:PAS domain S-box-containing protein
MGVGQPLARLAEPIHLPWVGGGQVRLGGGAGGGSESPDAPAAAALRRQIDLLLDGAEAGVYGVDRDGRATVVTPSVAAMTGHTVEALVGSAMHELLHHSHPNGDCYPREECPIYAAFRDGKVHHAEEVFWRKDGTSFPIEYTSAPLVQAGAVVGAVVVFRDLGRQREVRHWIHGMLDVLGEGGEHEGGVRRPAAGSRQSQLPVASQEQVRPVGASGAWLSVLGMARRAAAVDTTVLLLGESGTGKEPVARAIHEWGPRRGRPLVRLNCAAIPASLIESELYGHERGAFTGATAQRIGRFEQAGDGTLFLDEIGELSLEAQAKFLRVLQEREFERVGGTRTLHSRARVIAATNRDLWAMVQAGRFRADLFYRLNVFPMRLPPLRERREDIPLLVEHFLAKLAPRLGRSLRGFSPEAERALRGYDWPGNVRELENVVERAALLSDGPVLALPPLGPGALGVGAPSSAACEQRQHGAPSPDAIRAALVKARWKVTGPRGAAALLAMHPNTLRYRMRRLGIERPAK